MMLKLGRRGNAVASLQRDLNALADTGAIKLIARLETDATKFRKMKSLWIGKGLDGLVIRREREARWVESAIA